MGVRLQGEFRTLKDDQYQVQIIDSAYNGVVHNIKLDGNGFTLTHDGETDVIYSPIVGSSVSVGFYNESTAVDQFRTALLNAQDKQFSIRILKYSKPSQENILNDYRNRVVGDGGEFEAGNCVNDALIALGVGSESRSNIFSDYTKERVETDGGTYESENCVVSAINALGGTTDIPQELYSLYWTGYIAQDLIEEADESKPRLMEITAADGISLLSTVDYNFGLVQSNNRTFKEAIIEMLEDAGIASLFETDEPLLTSVVNWYAEEMTYSDTMDPLDNTKVDLKVFTFWTQGQEREYTQSLQVIREMCIIMGARFYFSGGSYRFEQIGERDKINIREFKYLKSGTQDSLSTVVQDVLVDQDEVFRSQGVFRFLPAVKRVELIQERKSEANLIGGVVTYDSQFGDEIDVGIIPSADNGRINLQMRSKFQTYIQTPLVGVATPVFEVYIRLEPSDGTADQYYTNSLVSGFTSFGPGSWGTTYGSYKWAATNVSRQVSSTTRTLHAMATAPLPKDGEIYIDITILGFYDSQGSSTSFFTGSNTFAWAVDLERAQFVNDNTRGTVQSTFYAINSSTNLGSNIEVSLGPISLGDGPGAAGSLRVYTGSVYTPSTGWRQGNSGDYVDVSKLVTKEILALQAKVVNRFEGLFINGGEFHKRLRFDGAYWLPLRSSLNANRDEIQFEAFKIAKISAFADISNNPIEIGDATENIDVYDYQGQYINASNGVVGGMTVDSVNQTLGPFQETATGAQINGTANVTGNLYSTDVIASGEITSVDITATGDVNVSNTISAGGDITTTSDISGRDVTAANNADVGGTLDVEGATTLATTSVGEFTTTGRVNVTINDIVGGPGGSETLSLSNNVNFISWETGEGNGTYTLNLPSSQSGVIMRFKTDDTIEANKTIRLLPQSGEAIDGEGAYTMDRSFDGITLMGHNNNWFVIQKKEK